MSAIGTKDAGRERKRRRGHACGADIDAVDVDQVMRQPQGKSHEGAEHEKVVEREAPDLQVLERRQFCRNARSLATRLAPCLEYGIVLGENEEDHGNRRQRERPYVGHRLPAKGDHDERSAELGHGRADIAGAEYAQCRTLLLARIPMRDIGDTDCKRATRQANAECRDQEHRKCFRLGQQPGSHRRQQHLDRENQPTAILFGPDAQHQPGQRTGEDRRCNQDAELRLIEPELGFDLHADDRKDRPNCKTDCECDGAEPQCAVLVCACDALKRMHLLVPQISGGLHRRSKQSGAITIAVASSHLIEIKDRAAN